MEDIEGIIALLIPISICCVLPILIVWIVARSKNNAENKRAEVLIEAIKANTVDPAELTKALSKPVRPEKTPLQVLNSRLMKGCIWSLLGLAFLIMFAFAGNFPEFADSEGSLLLIGSCLMAVGISYLVVYAFTRKSVLEAARKEESENNPEADC